MPCHPCIPRRATAPQPCKKNPRRDASLCSNSQASSSPLPVPAKIYIQPTVLSCDIVTRQSANPVSSTAPLRPQRSPPDVVPIWPPLGDPKRWSPRRQFPASPPDRRSCPPPSPTSVHKPPSADP